MKNWLLTLLLCSTLALLTSCGGSKSTNTATDSVDNSEGSDADAADPDADDSESDQIIQPDPVADACSPTAVKSWVTATMRDKYLFYNQMPVLDESRYDSPDDLVIGYRVPPDRWSLLTNQDTDARLRDFGRSFGLGFRFSTDDSDRTRFAMIRRDSPIANAGVKRGDVLIGINNVLVNDFPENWFQFFQGTEESPKTATWTILDGNTMARRDVELTPSVYDVKTVLYANAFFFDGFDGTVGYLAMSSFYNTSANELDSVFRYFKERNTTELVLDLRYHGGGRVNVSRKMVSLILGPDYTGQPYLDYRFNDKYPDRDLTLEITDEVNSLGLDRITVLVSESTGSAAESVIVGLQPYIPVTVLGNETTAGKSFVSYGRDNCGRRLKMMEAEVFNASGVSARGGLYPQCAAQDDLTTVLGVERDDQGAIERFEGMLNAGLNSLLYGQCDAPQVASAAQRLKARAQAAPANQEFAEATNH